MGVVSRCYFFLLIKQSLLDGSIIIRGVILALFLSRLQVLVHFEEVEAVFLEFGGAKFVAEARHDSKLRKRVSRGINESEGGKATRKLGREFRERET